MAKTPATVKVPIIARVLGKDVELGVLELEVQLVNGRAKAPREREIKNALRRGLR